MRRLYRQKLTTSLGGNISRKEGDFLLVTPSQKDKALLKTADILVVSLSGKAIDTELKPSMEMRFHLAIYKERADIRAIIHAHPFWGTWLAITHTLPNLYLTDEACYMIRRTALCNYATMGSEKLAKEIAKKIKTNDVLILKNHGVVTTGKTLTEAMERLEVLENIARYTFMKKQKVSYKKIPKEAIEAILTMP